MTAFGECFIQENLMKKIVLVMLAFGLAGCSGMNEQEAIKAVAKRAAYDLQCKEENIKVTKLQEIKDPIRGVISGTFGAAGCEKQMTFTANNDPNSDEPKIYKEGAAPNPVVINQPNIVKPYVAPSVYSPPYRGYGTKY